MCSSDLEGDEIYEYPPAFSDTANGDFSLSIASLAIGAGVSEYEDVDAPAYDYNNSSRPNPAGSNPDLGAYENSLAATPYPGKPQSLTVSSVDDSTVTLSWTAGLRASTPDGYHIVQQSDFHLSLTDFFVPVDVSIDQISGQVWIVDRGEGSVVKIAANGSIIRRFVALVLPVALAVDAGPR